jgi:hypothetical protein
MRKRCIYLVVSIMLMIVEIIIAVFVRDRWIRPYGGDVLAVAFVYCCIRIFMLRSVFLPAVFSFGFACGIEILQAFHLAAIPWIASTKILVIILGSTFVYNDILLYAVGALVSLGVDTLIRHICCNENSSEIIS